MVYNKKDPNSPFSTMRDGFKKPSYKGYSLSTTYITARDGVEIAANILLPKGLEENKKVSTILVQTRYWRGIQLKKPFSWFVEMPTNPGYTKGMAKYGFAIVETDVRGCGATYGNRYYPISLEEIKDGADVADWIIGQDWSDGNIVTWGNSYTAMTSECAITLNHPAIKAAVVRHNPWDLYTSSLFPGGVYNKWFSFYWSSLGRMLDKGKGSGFKQLKGRMEIKILFSGCR